MHELNYDPKEVAEVAAQAPSVQAIIILDTVENDNGEVAARIVPILPSGLIPFGCVMSRSMMEGIIKEMQALLDRGEITFNSEVVSIENLGTGTGTVQ